MGPNDDRCSKCGESHLSPRAGQIDRLNKQIERLVGIAEKQQQRLEQITDWIQRNFRDEL